MKALYLREKAARCRYLADIATNRDVREALDVLAREFDDEAEVLEAQGDAAPHRGGDASVSSDNL
jgi:hypothetical protein